MRRRKDLVSWSLTVALAFLLLMVGGANARIFYVEQATGNDSNSGTESQPFESLGRAVSVMSSGDTCMVGDGIYRDVLNLPSGVTIEAIPGTTPELTGTKNLDTQWSIYEGNIYVADISGIYNNIDVANYQVFVDGRAIVEARYPNLPTPYISSMMEYKRAVCQAGTNSGTIVGSSLPPGNLAGAILTVWPGNNGFCGWSACSREIASSSGNNLNLSRSIDNGGSSYVPYPGDPFYVSGALCLLDAPGEYCLDTKTEKLYIYMPNGDSPQDHRIDLRDAPTVINARNVSDITLKGLHIYGSGVSLQNVSNLDMEDCSIKYADNLRMAPGFKAAPRGSQNVTVTGDSIVIRKCEFGVTSSSGIRLGGKDILFTDNIVHDCDYSGANYAGVSVAGGTENAEISFNSIYRCGRSLITFEGSARFKKCVIENNLLKDNSTLTSDCGVFYSWGTDGGGTELKNNFVEPGNEKYQGTMTKLADGLYVDNYCSNFLIDHNIVIGGTSGIRTNLPNANTSCYNNTVIGSEYGYGIYGYPGKNADMSTQAFFNNLFINLQINDIHYYATENGVLKQYYGNLKNGKLPVPFDSSGKAMSRNNVSIRSRINPNFQPINGEPPGVGAIEIGAKLFAYGADWKL